MFLRIDARDVDTPDSPVDGDGKLAARTVDGHLPRTAVDLDFVLHDC